MFMNIDSYILSCKTNVTYPPNMARRGRTGESKAFAKYTNSFFNRKPAAFKGKFTPTIELGLLNFKTNKI